MPKTWCAWLTLKFETILVTSWYILSSTTDGPFLKFIFIISFTMCTNKELQCKIIYIVLGNKKENSRLFSKVGYFHIKFSQSKTNLCDLLLIWDRGWQTFSVKKPESKYSFCEPYGLWCNPWPLPVKCKNYYRRYSNDWAWLCSNKNLFSKTNHRPPLVHRL